MSSAIAEKEKIVRKYVLGLKETGQMDVEAIRKALNAAKKEWSIAQEYFNLVSEPDLIDYAIFNEKACEKKYMYLLKQAKKLNIIC